jgi:hypothetical protein
VPLVGGRFVPEVPAGLASAIACSLVYPFPCQLVFWSVGQGLMHPACTPAWLWCGGECRCHRHAAGANLLSCL